MFYLVLESSKLIIKNYTKERRTYKYQACSYYNSWTGWFTATLLTQKSFYPEEQLNELIWVPVEFSRQVREIFLSDAAISWSQSS